MERPDNLLQIAEFQHTVTSHKIYRHPTQTGTLIYLPHIIVLLKTSTHPNTLTQRYV